MSKTQAPPRCPRCYRRHRSWQTLAACRIPRPLWVAGSGPWASISWCMRTGPQGPTVQLYESRAGAVLAKELIDKFSCGGRCSGPVGHKVMDLAGGD